MKSSNSNIWTKIIAHAIAIIIILFQVVCVVLGFAMVLAFWGGIGFLIYTLIVFLWAHMGVH